MTPPRYASSNEPVGYAIDPLSSTGIDFVAAVFGSPLVQEPTTSLLEINAFASSLPQFWFDDNAIVDCLQSGVIPDNRFDTGKGIAK